MRNQRQQGAIASSSPFCMFCLLSWALEQLANRAQSTQYTLLHGADDLPAAIVEAWYDARKTNRSIDTKTFLEEEN